MKLGSLFATTAFASPLVPFMLMEEAESDTTKMMLMMNAMNMYPTDPLSQILPLMMLTDDSSTTTTTTTTATDDDNSKALMMMMLMNPSASGDLNSIMPYLMYKDDSVDLKSVFLYSNILGHDCHHDANTQISSLLPMMLAKETDENEKLKTMIMFQMMAGAGQSIGGMDHLMQHIVLGDEIHDNPLMMILLQSMTGHVNSHAGYDSAFNMMLPLALHDDCDDEATDAAKEKCFKKQRDYMTMMLMMGAQTPNSGVSINSILPMLLMDGDDNNELLIMFMMMQSQPCHPIAPVDPVVVVPQPEPEEIIYRTWRLNADGTRTLVSEGETPQ